MTPRMPIARARVSVSASIRVPTTRIVPASPTSRPPGRSPPLRAGGQAQLARASGRRASTMPRIALAGRPERDRRARARTSRTMPATGASSGSGTSPVARRHLPRHVNRSSPPSSVWRTPAGPDPAVARPAGARRRVGRRRDRDLLEARRRAAARRSGAPTTTDSPTSTSGRSPGASGKTASTGDSISRRHGHHDRSDRRRSVMPALRAGPAACQARSCSRRPSARSGSRSGTSRRSTSRPLRPPATSMAKPRPRPPSRTVSRNRKSATAPSPGSSVDEGQLAGRQVARPLRTVAVDGEPCPAGPAGPQAGRHDQRPERRQQVVGEVAQDGPTLRRRRGWRRAAPAARRGRRRAGSRRAGAGRRPGSGPRATAASTARPRRRRRRGPGHRSAPCRRSRPAAGPARHGRPRRGGRGPPRSHRPTARSAARASGRGCGAGPIAVVVQARTRSTDVVVGFGRGEAGGRDDGQVEPAPARSPVAGRATARVAPSYPISSRSTRRSTISARVAASRSRAPVGRRPRTRTAPGAGRAAASPAGPDPGGRRQDGLAGSACRVAELGQPLGHPAGEHDQPVRPADRDGGDERGEFAERAPLVGRGRVGRPRPGRRRSRRRGAAGSSSADRSSGRSPTTVRQPLRAAAATSGASARSVAATTARVRAGLRADLEADQVAGVRAVDAEALQDGRVGAPDAGRGATRWPRPGRRRSGRRGRADQAPGAAELADEGDGDGGGAEVDGRERAGLGGHRSMLPVIARRRASRHRRRGGEVDRSVRRPRSSRRRSPRAA